MGSVVQVRPEARIDAVEHGAGFLAERGDDDRGDDSDEVGEHHVRELLETSDAN